MLTDEDEIIYPYRNIEDLNDPVFKEYTLPIDYDERVFKFLGTDILEEEFENYKVKEYYSGIRELAEFFNTEDELLIDLLINTITVPSKRLNIYQCLNHSWFMS